jgi:PKD repeat protein/ribosomal protein S11
MNKCWLSILLSLLISLTGTAQEVHPKIVPGKLVIKLDDRQPSTSFPQNILSSIKLKKSQELAPRQSSTKSIRSVLDGIFILELDKNEDILRLCDSLSHLRGVLYAEPLYQEPLLLIPNDPEAQIGASQSYLEIISAYDAWETTTGNEDIIIGIVDTGSDLTHEDLSDKFHVSPDIINGVDDDGNGYIDDYQGYDFADNDNDPQADANPHGTRVAGIAGATPNNGKGIAGVGYNCSISALKAYSSVSSYSFGGYEAIQYAADNGYAVVNLSWGSAYSYSQFNQDIITYAVVEKDMVVVAAAGNSNLDEPFYPASYEYVLSVAATDNNDLKASFSTFNQNVDLSAPGVSIYSTINGGYAAEGGTSYAAPMVAGAVALVRSFYPDFNAIEVMERIKATTDPIYNIADNQPYLGKLGTGRLNVAQALNASQVVSMQSTLAELVAPFEQLFFGDTVWLYFEITNMLDPVYFAKAELGTTSDYVTIIHAAENLGYMTTGESSVLGPYQVYIHNDTPPDTKLELLLHLTDEERYDTYHAYDLYTAPNFVTLDNDSLALTIASNGNLGYATDGFLDGNGFTAGNQLANTLGFFTSFNDSIFLDNLPTDWVNGIKEQDFVSKTSIKPAANRDGSTFIFSVFEDADQAIRVEQTAVQWDSIPGLAMGMSYRIINLSTDTLWNVSSGLMIDYDIDENDQNMGWFDQVNTSYIGSGDSNLAGIRTLNADSLHRLIDVSSLEDTQDDSTKLAFLSNNVDSIGFDAVTNVALLTGNSIESLAPGDFLDIQLVFGGADTIALLNQQLELAEDRMASFRSTPPIQETYISCLGGEIELQPEPGSQFYFFSDAYAQDTVAVAESLLIPSVAQDTILFITKIDSLFIGPIRALQIKLIDNIADFSVPYDTIFLGDLPNNQITLTDESLLPITWFWDFGNGSQASGIQHPSPVYNSPGTYSIMLTVMNEQGCEDTATKTLTVLERPAQPVFAQFGYCPGEALTISSTDTLRFCAFKFGMELVLEGTTLHFEGLRGDSTLYISRVEYGLESTKKSIAVIENNVSADYFFGTVADSLYGHFAEFTLSNPAIQSASWLLDSLQESNQLAPIFEITNDTIRLDLTITTDSLCSATLLDSIFFEPPNAPLVNDLEFCLGDSILIAPEGGQLFGFYYDSLLSSPIAKAASLWLPQVLTDSTIYVTNLDQVIPGSIVSVDLFPFDYDLKIVASADTLYLDQSRLVDFSLNLPTASVKWYVDDVFETNSLEPRLFFNATGIHEVAAQGIHEIGCTNSDTIQIHAFEELIIPLGELPKLISIFPVPASQFLTIETEKAIEQIQITDLSGKEFEVIWHDTKTLDLSYVGNGIFLLTVRFTSGNEVVIKGVKRSLRE